MKKTTINILFEQEKLRALQFYAEKKDLSVEEELSGFITKLYEKYVPAHTREYIESVAEPEERTRQPMRPSRVPHPESE